VPKRSNRNFIKTQAYLTF